MPTSLLSRSLTIFTLAVTFIPQNALAGLYRPVSWTAQSVYASPKVGIRAPGIGGIQIKTNSRLNLSPSALSYVNGNLLATINGRSLSLRVNPIELNESVKLVKLRGDSTFQVSVDNTAIGNSVYFSSSIRNTIFGELFRIADLEFAAMIQGRLPLPSRAPRHPYEEALRLLRTDKQYSKLSTEWINPPTDCPQLFLSFDLSAPTLVKMEPKPQIFFRSPDGHPVEVQAEVQAVGERPYAPLMKDIKREPSAYRASLFAVDRAASITVVLGLLRSACKAPRSCEHLLTNPQDSDRKELIADYNSLQKRLDDSRATVPQNRQDLTLLWNELGLRPFQSSQNDKAWGFAYDAVQRNIQYTYRLLGIVFDAVEQDTKLDRRSYDQQKALLVKAWKLAASQFLNYPIPNDPLLQAAHATVMVQAEGDASKKEAKQSLDKAINLSANMPGERIDVAEMGMYMATYMRYFLKDKSAGLLLEEMQRLRVEAKIAAYDEVDKYLSSCMKAVDRCSSKDLRTWEADTVRAGLYRDLKSRDIALLYGRFAYLVGLKEPNWRRDRLRFLSSYAKAAKTEAYRKELTKLETNLGRVLASSNN